MDDVPTAPVVVAAWDELAASWGSALRADRKRDPPDLGRDNCIKFSDHRCRVADYRPAGEPAAHSIFHRSMATLIASVAGAGSVLDALDEPIFDLAADTTSEWRQWPSIPLLVGPLRPMPAELPVVSRCCTDT